MGFTPTEQRAQMVLEQLQARGITDRRVLETMGTVERELFVPEGMASHAYQDGALPIGNGQTISQPYIVALMAQALGLAPDSRVLEVGTGSGYGAAVLGRMAGQVVTVERLDLLADAARDLLAQLGYTNIDVVCGDGSLGWPAAAPYDGIVVTAGGPDVPPALLGQLADGGRLVIPVGPSRTTQQLVQITRQGSTFTRRSHGAVRFIPLIGRQGW